ncbi:MAG TPA: hypothetical protein VK448_02995 [Dissulfurispiraceae bacterium]|nr:hypothetical protein [Dissulfurispiraceae bacterium]
MKTSFIIIWFLSVTLAFVVGYTHGVGERYEAVERAVLFDYGQQLKQAIKDGIPFKLKGSDVTLMPRNNSQMEASAAGLKTYVNQVRQASE